MKSGRLCRGCLPLRLGNCVNTVRTQPSQATTLSPLSPQSHILHHHSALRPRHPRTLNPIHVHHPSCFRPPDPLDRILHTALTRRLPLMSLRPHHTVLSPLVFSYLRSPPWQIQRSPGALVFPPLRLLIPSMPPMTKLCTGNRTFSKFPLAEQERPLSLNWRVYIEHSLQVLPWNRLL